MTPHASTPTTGCFAASGASAPRGVFSLIRNALLSVVAISFISGCGYFTKKPDTNALCISECPDLMALPDDTFGSTSKALAENANIYYNCRKACQPKK